MAYRVEFTPEADQHLAGLTARERATLLDEVERQLLDQPTVETRNRKPMRPNPLAPWELRIGRLRVYYEVGGDVFPVVTVRAIGVKVRDRVRIGGEWWELGQEPRTEEGR